MSEFDRLQAQAIREAHYLDAQVYNFTEELRLALSRVDARIAVLLREFETDTTGRLTSTRRNLEEAISARDAILQAVQESGVPQAMVNAVDQPFEGVLNIALPQDLRDDLFMREALDAMKNLRLGELLGLSDDVARVIWRSTLDGVVGARPIRDLVSDISEATQVTARQARSLYDTAISTYSRQAAQLASDGTPEEHFVYVGPIDRIMRPFCAKLIGRVFPRSEIDTMDNGQIPNVLLSGGGYNCRHTWRRVSVFSTELQGLAKSRKRDPAVVQRLKALKEDS